MDTQIQEPLSNEERRRRERKVWRSAFLVALAIHLAVLLLWRTRGPLLSPFAAAGPRSGDDRAAAGSMQAINVATRPSLPIVPPPVPLPTIDNIEPIEFDEDVRLEDTGLKGFGEGFDGPGLENGTGQGDGGTSDQGLYRMVPPQPRGMIAPDFAEALRGHDVQVWVFVDATGRVVPDSTRLEPPTKDRDLNKRLIRDAAEWVFKPAVQGGKPIAAWFPYKISIGGEPD